MRLRLLFIAAGIPAVLGLTLLTATSDAAKLKTPTLVARAVLPADTFADGPPSGAFITDSPPINGRTPPFPGQPVQGISALIRAGDDRYWAMPDNGYGAKGNSADFLLRVYEVRPSFETVEGGSGTVS